MVKDRKQIVVSSSDDAEASIMQLRACLSKDDGEMWRGCQDASQDYQFRP